MFKNYRPSEATSASFDERVWLSRVRIFFIQANGTMPSIVAAAFLLGIDLYMGGVQLHILAAWALMLIALSGVTSLFEHFVRRTELTIENCNQLLTIRIGLGAGLAMLCGITGFLMPNSVPLQDTFLFIVLSTIVTLGTLGYAVMPSYYVTLLAVSLLPLTGHFFWQYYIHNEAYYGLLFAGSVVWQVIVLIKARQASETAINAILLNHRLEYEMEEHRHTKEAFRHLALHDALTDLANRRYFEETITRTMNIASRNKTRFAVLSIDLNDFKPINDRYGHAIGDLVLKGVAGRLNGVIRASDFCARIGGDEFIVIIANEGVEISAIEVANKLRLVVAEPLIIGDISFCIRISIGKAIYPEDGIYVDDLLALADERMYKDKNR